MGWGQSHRIGLDRAILRRPLDVPKEEMCRGSRGVYTSVGEGGDAVCARLGVMSTQMGCEATD